MLLCVVETEERGWIGLAGAGGGGEGVDGSRVRPHTTTAQRRVDALAMRALAGEISKPTDVLG